MSFSARLNISVLLFFLFFFLLICSGRLSSGDAVQEFTQSEVLARTGSWGSQTKIEGLWIEGPDHRCYETHDPGNALLMLPVAKLAMLKHPSIESILFQPPPLWAKSLFALEVSLLCALASFFLFRLFLLLNCGLLSFGLALLFPLATSFGTYSRSAWDVVPACCGVCFLLYTAAKMLSGRSAAHGFIWSCFNLAFTAHFRYTLLPFLGLGLAIAAWSRRREISLYSFGTGIFVFGFLMSDVLYLNWLRTGSVFRPATSVPKWVAVGTADLHGNLWAGLYGQVLSPQRGLLFYCPCLLLITALPWVWQKISTPGRWLLYSFGTGAVLYTLVISKIRVWNSFGWGPRYLLPILPIAFVASALVMRYGGRTLRRCAVCLVGLSIFCTAPTLLINWHQIVSVFDRTSDPTAHESFYQQRGAWWALGQGLKGKALPADTEQGQPLDSLDLKFPDLWTAYLIRSHGAIRLVGVGAALFLLIGTVWSFLMAWRLSVQQLDEP